MHYLKVLTLEKTFDTLKVQKKISAHSSDLSSLEKLMYKISAHSSATQPTWDCPLKVYFSNTLPQSRVWVVSGSPRAVACGEMVISISSLCCSCRVTLLWNLIRKKNTRPMVIPTSDKPMEMPIHVFISFRVASASSSVKSMDSKLLIISSKWRSGCKFQFAWREKSGSGSERCSNETWFPRIS